jgi:trehalose 6-phosphate synthase
MNRLVVVSNRVPSPALSGNQAGGLAVALEGLMEKRGGVWFGWSGDIVDDTPAAAARTVEIDRVTYATIDLTREEHERYYNNYSNSVLWPLLHTMPDLVEFDRADGVAYRAVNARMADMLLPMLRPDDLIWIHDYHLIPLAALLRARGVRAPIGFFLHIPFPSADVLSSVPDVAGLVRDLLAADLIGFQTDRDVENFAAAAQALGGAGQYSDEWLQVGSHRVRLGAFPVEIDSHEFAETAASAWRALPTERLRRSLPGQRLIIGIDRLDPTKGLIQRLAGYRRLLETRPEWRRRTTLLQIAAVSRKDVTAYRDLRTSLDRETGSINSDFGDPDWTPLRVNARGVPRAQVAGFMREARVGLVTPLRDGMNLVAKEYVAAQNPQDPGVLVLSQFAGAARQLDQAILVNPHDVDDVAEALDRALRMRLDERQQRWYALWRSIADASPLNWGRSFIAALLRAALIGDAPSVGRRGVRSGRRAAAGASPLSHSSDIIQAFPPNTRPN